MLFFAALIIGGKSVPTTSVIPMDGPAKAAQMKRGDTILNIDGIAVTDWDQMRALISARANKPLDIVVLRGTDKLTLKITPQLKDGGGKIGVTPVEKQLPVGLRERRRLRRLRAPPSPTHDRSPHRVTRPVAARRRPIPAQRSVHRPRGRPAAG